MPTLLPSASFMSRMAAWLVDVALCAIPAMFVAWAMVRVPAVALVEAAPIDGSMEVVQQHLMAYLKIHLLAFAWFTAGLVAAYGALTVVREAGLHQATPGKRIMGLQVEDMQGRAPTTRQAALRFFAGSLSWISLNLGHAMVMFRADRRALHDLVAGLRVVTLPQAPGRPSERTLTAVILIASVIFWAVLPGPVPDSPMVENLIQQVMLQGLSPGMNPALPNP